MKALIDANLVLDVLQKRTPFFEDSLKIWKLCETEKIEGFISTLTFANLVYVMRKELSPETIDDVFKRLSLIFHFVSMTVDDVANAIEMKWNDFEDAVQSATAKRICADFIISRNSKDFQKSDVAVVSPAEFLAIF